MKLKFAIFANLVNFFVLFGFKDELLSEACGRRLAGRGNIVGGNYTLRGSFPWVAALMNSNGLVFCGGTLITKNKVVTAAHCIRGKDDHHEFSAGDITVILGAHNLSIPHERGKFVVGVQEIQTHSDWNTKSKSFDADIAMLTLTDDINFSRYIQPICLIEPDSIVAKISKGYTVGYGKSEDKTKNIENVLKVVETPIQGSNEECFYTSDVLLKISSKRTFCGGSRDGTGVCLGDSGNGLFVERQNVFYLRGIVSTSLMTLFSCDVNNYAVFTNVLKFYDWISENINSGGSRHIYDSMEMLPTDQSVETTSITMKFTQSTTTVTPILDECGKPKLRLPKMINGAALKPGSYPWNAFIKTGYPRTSCGGTLVSKNKVITVAHCVYDKDEDFPIKEIHLTVVLGFQKPDNFLEPGRKSELVKKIYNHPDWNTDTSSYDADITVLLLRENVEFSEYIRPICMIAPGSVLNNFNEGFLVGSLELNPLELKISIHADDECMRVDPKYKVVSSERAFCGGSAKGFTSCKENFGNGLIVNNGSVFYLRGIVSVSLRKSYLGCRDNAYALFTDVSKFYDWINELP